VTRGARGAAPSSIENQPVTSGAPSDATLAARSLRLQAAAATGSASAEELTRFLLGEVVADHMLTEDRRFADLFAGGR
jgi:hypothetical protein